MAIFFYPITKYTHMETLLETLNTTREETISLHYGAATAELKEMVKKEPLRTLFIIRAGCVSEEITFEIARRFTSGGVKTTACKGGFVSTQHYLTVDVSLPEHLVQPETKEDEPVSELPVELKIVEEVKLAEEVATTESA